MRSISFYISVLFCFLLKLSLLLAETPQLSPRQCFGEVGFERAT